MLFCHITSLSVFVHFVTFPDHCRLSMSFFVGIVDQVRQYPDLLLFGAVILYVDCPALQFGRTIVVRSYDCTSLLKLIFTISQAHYCQDIQYSRYTDVWSYSILSPLLPGSTEVRVHCPAMSLVDPCLVHRYFRSIATRSFNAAGPLWRSLTISQIYCSQVSLSAPGVSLSCYIVWSRSPVSAGPKSLLHSVVQVACQCWSKVFST